MIDSNAFYGCTGLTCVTIPSSVNKIDSFAFQNCKGLTSVTIPDGVMTISNSAFTGCTGLTDVTISDSVTAIGKFAFKGCAGLTDVFIPSSVTSMGEDVFSGCNEILLHVYFGSYAYGYAVYCRLPYVLEAESISFPETAVTVFQGQTKTLSVSFQPSLVTDSSLTWSSSDSSVAAVEDGVVTGISPGEAVITAETYNGKTAACTVTVLSNTFRNTSALSKTTVPQRTMVTVTGSSAFGKGIVTYAFYYKKSTSSSWTSVGQKYAGITEVTFIPNMAATYQVMVKAKDESGKVLTKIMELTVTDPSADDLVNRSAISKTDAQTGEAISLTGKASGGAGDYFYAFYLKKSGSQTFTPAAQPYSGKTKVYWRPAEAGDYTVRIFVQDAAGTVAVKEYTLSVSAS